MDALELETNSEILTAEQRKRIQALWNRDLASESYLALE
jgi:hypothetical protein